MTDKNIKRLTLNEIREKKKKLLQEAKSKATNTNKAKEKKNPSTKKPTVAKKRKGRFKTGSYQSQKCTNGPMLYRSGWELIVGQFLDLDSEVQSWQYEPFKIQWVSNTKTGRIRLYIPDFFIIYCNGTKKLVEVKGDRFVNRPTVQKKARMGISWAKNNQAEYEMWTGKKIAALKKIVEAAQVV
jgi:hypothetical protein